MGDNVRCVCTRLKQPLLKSNRKCIALNEYVVLHENRILAYIDFNLDIKKVRFLTFAKHSLRSHKAGSESGYSTNMSNSSDILVKKSNPQKYIFDYTS